MNGKMALKQSNKPSAGMELDTAEQILHNVFSACHQPPSTLSVQTIQQATKCSTKGYLVGKILAGAVLVMLLLMPLLLNAPRFQSRVNGADDGITAQVTLDLHSIFPIEAITATLNGRTLSFERLEGKRYEAQVDQNGVIDLTITTKNGQLNQGQIAVSVIDQQSPTIVDDYQAGGMVYVTLEDDLSGVDFNSIYAIDADGNRIRPERVDPKHRQVAFALPTQSITLFIPDHKGNVLHAVLTPKTP